MLVNKQDITDLNKLQIEEEAGLASAYEALLNEARVDTPMSCELIQHIHTLIFGNLFEWAGRWRTVNISKPGTTWPPPAYIDDHMQKFEQDFLNKYPATALATDKAFCEAIGIIQGEFLVIHPFREGNARTIKLLADLLAVQSGRQMLRYDTSETGQAAYIEAAKAAFMRQYDPLIAIIRQALQ